MRSIRSAACSAAAVLFALLFLFPTAAAAQDDGDDGANYRLAARFAPYRIGDLLHDTAVSPRWIEGSERFWYEWESSDGSVYYLVDPAAGTRMTLFDQDRLAAELTRITGDPYVGRDLPIRSIRFLDANTLRFEVQSTQDEVVEDEDEEMEDDEQDEQQQDRTERREKTRKKVHYFEYDVRTRTLRELEEREEPDDHPSWASVSPDGETVVYARHHNLYRMSGADYARILDARRGKDGDEADEAEEDVEVEEVQLTTGGEEHYSYAVGGYGDTDKEKAEKADERKRARIAWAKDSRRFAVSRTDERKSGDLWVIHTVGNKRPELESYKYDMPGEKDVSQDELGLYDLARDTLVMVQSDAWKDQELFVFTDRQFRFPDSDEPYRALWLGPDSDRFHFGRRSRDHHRFDVLVADAETGAVDVLVEERLNTYIEHADPEMLPNGDFLWWSERDGWAHLYRYGADGTLKNRLTEGPWSDRGVEGVDAERGVVYFTATGREDGEDPYYEHLYRVDLDGDNLRLLNPGAYDHRVSLGASNRYFVSNHSRVDTTPEAALYETSGRKVMDLETADFTRLLDAGYRFPEPYTVKAADGVTDLYGVMYKPFDFDSTKTYPIVAYVYPGPQTEAVAKSFSTSRYETALAQFGFIVVTVGNRGGHPARSKNYHNYGYGNLRDYGLADKKAVLEQLADRHDYVDLGRVGIYGHSGGGFMSTAAMLVYPDFFHVAVSSAGNHTNDIYNQWWSEKHHGVKEVVSDSGEVSFTYDIDTNPELAKNLKGRLLLTTGDVDNNVHPGNTYRMAEALIKANKRFDFFLFPGQRHGFGDMSDYWFWLRAEYFVEHLLGDDRWDVDMVELNRERARTR